MNFQVPSPPLSNAAEPHRAPSTDDQAASGPGPAPNRTLPLRACEECKRKKTKCDMVRPICSLCARTGAECVFPTKRKPPRLRRRMEAEKQKDPGYDRIRNEQIDRLLQLVNSGTLFGGGLQDSEPAVLPEETPDLSNAPVTSEWSSIPYNPPGNNGADIGNEFGADTSDWNMGTPVAPYGHMTETPFPTSNAMSAFPRGFQRDMSLSQSGLMGESNAVNLTHSSSMDFLDDSGAVPRFPSSLGYPTESYESSTSPEVGGGRQSSQRSADWSTLIVPSEVADHLVELYFEKAHGFIPILNQPLFFARYFQGAPPVLRYGSCPADTRLILYGMFALTARFSNHEYFSNVAPKERGKPFATEAQSIIQRSLLNTELDCLCLSYLQGCALCAYYWLTYGPNVQGWLLTGICCRMASFLGLNTVDEDLVHVNTQNHLSADEWVRREELRRMWWSVWELDSFASALSMRPFNIDRERMHVMLPAHDRNWYTATPTTSAFANPDPLVTWKSLKASGNTNPYAWFLLANQLMIYGHELARKDNVSSELQEDVESALSAFALSMPEHFDLSSGGIIFEDGKHADSNWIIGAHIILQGARAYMVYVANENSTSSENAYASSTPSSLPSTDSDMQSDASGDLARKCRPFLSAIVRAIKAWSPEHVALASPFLVCQLIGPYASMVGSSNSAAETQRSTTERDIIELTISRWAKFWPLGSLVLELFQITSGQAAASPGESPALRADFKRRFAALLPKPASESIHGPGMPVRSRGDS